MFLCALSASKAQIKEAFLRLYSTKVRSVNTLIRPDGKKKAFIRLSADSDSLSLANKIGIIWPNYNNLNNEIAVPWLENFHFLETHFFERSVVQLPTLWGVIGQIPWRAVQLLHRVFPTQAACFLLKLPWRRYRGNAKRLLSKRNQLRRLAAVVVRRLCFPQQDINGQWHVPAN